MYEIKSNICFDRGANLISTTRKAGNRAFWKGKFAEA